MSMYRHRDGLFWPSLFSISGEKEKKDLLKWIEEYRIDYASQGLAYVLFEVSSMNHSEYRADDPCMQAACEHVALKFMLCDSDLAKDLLGEEELAKANEVYARKQYNSKLLQKLLCDFLNLLLKQRGKNNLGNLFTIAIIDELRKVEENEINRTYGDLKKTIEKVASGVKSNCYYEAERSFYDPIKPLNDSLNQFLLNKLGYNFNQANERHTGNGMSTLFCSYEQKVSNSILQLALVNEKSFWEKHENFGVIVFLNEIVKLNDIRHAEKVISFIAENLKKMAHMDLVFEHGFPLWMSKYDELVESLEDQAFRFSFKRLEAYCDLSKIKNIPLCHPMSEADPAFFEIGKHVWEHFIRDYNYPNDFEAVESYFVSEVNRFISGETHERNDIAVILDATIFRYAADNEDRRLFSAYHPDCFSSENIWKRVYLKAYAVTLLSDNEQMQFSYLQRIFVDLIKAVERRIGICTVHQLDTGAREKNFEELKKLLGAYGIEATNEHKDDYIISLLDRDTALIEEADAFPVLEQIGDAIYGLAVAELLFYDPNTEGMAEKYEDFTRAEAQVLISKKLGFDKLYLQIGLPGKYVEFDTLSFNADIFNTLLRNTDVFNYEKIEALNREKYFADSLEMIIGSVYRDLGIEKAIGFAKKLLLATFPKQLHNEVRPTEENKHNKDIDMDYWSRILPSPFSVMTGELHTLWNALNKVILIASLGTDDKDKRNYITNSFSNTAIYGESHNYGATWAFHDYLNNGLMSVLEKYGETIRDNYKNNKKF
ncbi:MAG: hypothetical protein J6T24_06430 [Clostridia bacterium]|nr:hypothetical protein [Clostridia bacterium]